MSVKIQNQLSFYDWQLQEMDLSWAKYHGAKILDLYEQNSLYIGRIWGYDEKRGVLILRFKKGRFPRLKVPLTISSPKSSIGSLANWDFTYSRFREDFVQEYSNCTPVFYLQNQQIEDYRYVGIKNISVEFLEHIKIDLEQKTHSIVVLGAEDPPREYLVALRNFTKNNPLNETLNISFNGIDSWRPQNLSDPTNLVDQTLEILSHSENTIIQGPPGTGKTYLIAQICEYYLNTNKRVCITALTHKALMEAASKESLRSKCKNKKVFKTNLSADEQTLIPGLQNHSILNPIAEGNLVLSTYYSLSQLLMNEVSKVYYDLLIIEEASQAFLTTIAGFSTLAKKVLVVGDFMQLQPIVLEANKALNIDKDILTLVNGLKTYSASKEKDSYRLINTFRLNKSSASQTGVFYDNDLISNSTQKGLTLEGYDLNWFCPEGGSSLLYLEKMDEGKNPENAIELVIKLIKDIRFEHPTKELAVLSAFKDTVNNLIDGFLNENIGFNNLEVNTVDRIQGMTVDICIYLIPSYKTKFSFDDNRFNVATSRAKNGTIIIAEDLISNRKLLSEKVLNYIAKTNKYVVNE